MSKRKHIHSYSCTAFDEKGRAHLICGNHGPEVDRLIHAFNDDRQLFNKIERIIEERMATCLDGTQER